MLQRRQQCETVRAKSTPALEAYGLVTMLANVAGVNTSLDTCTHFDLTQQQSVVVVIYVKSDGLAEHVFRICEADGLGRTFGSFRCHSSEQTYKPRGSCLASWRRLPLDQVDETLMGRIAGVAWLFDKAKTHQTPGTVRRSDGLDPPCSPFHMQPPRRGSSYLASYLLSTGYNRHHTILLLVTTGGGRSGLQSILSHESSPGTGTSNDLRANRSSFALTAGKVLLGQHLRVSDGWRTPEPPQWDG